MEFKEFNVADFGKTITDGAFIAINQSGSITLSRSAVKLLGADDNHIYFKLLENSSTGGLYIRPSKKEIKNSFKARLNTDGYGIMCKTALTKHLADKYQLAIGNGRKKYVRLPIIEEGVAIDGGVAYFIETK